MHPLTEYPRPTMRRDSYENLNGLWQYAITASAQRPAGWDGEILVPTRRSAAPPGWGAHCSPGSGCTTTDILRRPPGRAAGCCCISAQWTTPALCR